MVCLGLVILIAVLFAHGKIKKKKHSVIDELIPTAYFPLKLGIEGPQPVVISPKTNNLQTTN